MPRPKISFVHKNIQSKPILPRHLVILSSQQEGDCLINPCNKAKFSLQIKKLQHNINVLKASAFDSNKIALSLNQIGKKQQVFVINHQAIQFKKIEKLKQSTFPQIRNNMLKIHSLKLDDFSFLECKQKYQSKWCCQKYNQKYQELINPTFLFGQNLKTQNQECISLPFFKFDVPRYNTIAIKYFNINNQCKYAFAQGFLARVIQHQIQHINGKFLLDWRINHGNITMQKQVQEYFQKTSSVVQDFSKQLKQVFRQFPTLIETQPYFLQQKQQDFHRHSTIRSYWPLKSVYLQLLSFEDDFITRIVKHFKKEFDKFHQRVILGQIRLQGKNAKEQQGQNQQKNEYKISKKPFIVETDQKQGYLQKQYSKKITIKKLQSKTSQSQNLTQQYDLDQKSLKKTKKKKGKK